MRRCICLFVVFLTLSSGIISRAAQISKFELVTDAASLQAGDVLVIVSRSRSAGLSNVINSASISGIPVTFSGDCVVATTSLRQITLEGSASGWYLNVGSSYLCTTSTDKSLTSCSFVGIYAPAHISAASNRFAGARGTSLVRPNGQRVGSTEQGPDRGIHIVNGKKILIK